MLSNPGIRIALVVLNILAALAFVWMAALAQSKRSWAYEVYRYDLALQGLPVDDQEKDLDGRPLVNNLSDATLRSLFEGRQPVRTQQQAVEAKYSELTGIVNGMQEPQKRERLVALLRALARSGAERDAAAAMSTEELIEALNKAFAPARDPGRSLDQRRLAIAHVLINLADTPEERERVQRIVGLETYARELNLQAEALQEAARWADKNLESDRTAFEIHYRRLLQQLLAQAERVSDLKATLQEHRALSDKHRVLIANRQAEVKNFGTSLQTARRELDRALAEQAQLEKDLFEAQRQVGRLADENRRLEQQLLQQDSGR